MKLLPIESNYESFLSDESYLRGSADFIVFPKTIEEISEAIKTAGALELSVTIQGSRTGIVGGAVPKSGLIINLRDLSGITDLYRKNGQHFISAKAGTTLDKINSHALSMSCFFPPNPTEVNATIGGMYSSGSAGPSSLLYGRSSAFIYAVTWVNTDGDVYEIERGKFIFDESGCTMPDGSKLQLPELPSHVPFSSYVPQKGLDLIDFLSGNEGRFGAAAAFTLALSPLPLDIWGILFFFYDDKAAVAFAETLADMRNRLPHFTPVCVEFYDSFSLKLLADEKAHNSSLKTIPDFPGNTASSIYLELSGDDETELNLALFELLEIFEESGGNEADTWAEHGIDALNKLRTLRHSLPEAAGRVTVSSDFFAPRLETDFTGPPDKFTEYIHMYRDGLDSCGLEGIIYGHILNNSLHCSLFCKSKNDYDAACSLIKCWTQKTVNDGGLIVSENGIGRLKTTLIEEFEPYESKKNREYIKDFFDPRRLFRSNG